MRISLEIGLAMVLATLGAGCGALDQEPVSSNASLATPTAGADTAALPACTSIARPAGAIVLEEIDGDPRLIVRVGDAVSSIPVCTGTLDSLTGSGFLDGSGNSGNADNDPMPADGKNPGPNPMPNGSGLANNDPMPADGQTPTNTSPTTGAAVRRRGDFVHSNRTP